MEGGGGGGRENYGGRDGGKDGDRGWQEGGEGLYLKRHNANLFRSDVVLFHYRDNFSLPV